MANENNCMLKYCPGKLKYYDGAMGYEAMVCQTCGAHHTNEGIFPDKKRYAQVVKKYKR